MRNLKKILALVLALVMSLSLMATAGAAQFPDVDDSNPYKTAIDVLDELKVFQGFEDGTFKPTESLNRAQAAVLVYRIATGDVENKYLDNYTYMAQSKFNDLEGYNWAKGYINYCQNAGIVVGTSATTFDPGAPVTGYQLLVMVLRTLGYGKAGEFTDPKGWELQTASIAEREGILKNVTGGDFGSPAPRQMVAEILFRGILHDTVTYSALTSGGYTPSGESLGKKTLGLEDIKGVVMANEWADLEDDDTLAEGKTRLDVDGKVYNLDVSSELTDIGELRHAYVQNGTKVLTSLEDTGDNNVKDSKDLERRGEGITVAKLRGEVKLDDDTQYFVNFDPSLKDQSDWRIEYIITLPKMSHSEAHQLVASNKGVAWVDTNNNGKVDAGEDQINTKNADKGNSDLTIPEWTKDDVKYTGYTYSKVIPVRETITATDFKYIRAIFDSDGQTADSVIDADDIYDGEVYAGTSSKPGTDDKSNTMSYWEFYEKYIDPDTNNSFAESDNGEWLKVVDNDGDGVAEYVFLTTFCMTTVTDWNAKTETWTFETDPYDATAKVKAGDINLVDGAELALNDVILFTKIDGVYHVSEPAPVKMTVANKGIDYKAKTLTGTDETVYDWSEIDHKADNYYDDVSYAVQGVSYDLYQDHFGFTRLYKEADGGLVLLTDGYFETDRRDDLYKAQIWNGEFADVTVLDPVSAPANLFISNAVQNNGGLTIGNRYHDDEGTWARLYRFDSVYYNLFNYAQADHTSTHNDLPETDNYTYRTNIASYMVDGDGAYTLSPAVDHRENARTHYNSFAIDVTNYTVKAKDQVLWGIENVDANGAIVKANNQRINTTTETVYYLVEQDSRGELKISTWTGYNNAPSNYTVERAYAVSSYVAKNASPWNNALKYEVAEVVVIEATKEAIPNAYLAVSLEQRYFGNMQIGLNGLGYHPDTESWGIDTETMYVGKESTQTKTALEEEKAGWPNETADMMHFYYADPKTGEAVRIVDDFTGFGIYAGEVVTSNYVDNRNYVQITKDGTDNAEQKNSFFFPRNDCATYTVSYTEDADNYMRTNYDVSYTNDFRIGDQVVYMVDGDGNVGFVVNVTRSTWTDKDNHKVIIPGLAELYTAIEEDYTDNLSYKISVTEGYTVTPDEVLKTAKDAIVTLVDAKGNAIPNGVEVTATKCSKIERLAKDSKQWIITNISGDVVISVGTDGSVTTDDQMVAAWKAYQASAKDRDALTALYKVAAGYDPATGSDDGKAAYASTRAQAIADAQAVVTKSGTLNTFTTIGEAMDALKVVTDDANILKIAALDAGATNPTRPTKTAYEAAVTAINAKAVNYNDASRLVKAYQDWAEALPSGKTEAKDAYLKVYNDLRGAKDAAVRAAGGAATTTGIGTGTNDGYKSFYTGCAYDYKTAWDAHNAVIAQNGNITNIDLTAAKKALGYTIAKQADGSYLVTVANSITVGTSETLTDWLVVTSVGAVTWTGVSGTAPIDATYTVSDAGLPVGGSQTAGTATVHFTKAPALGVTDVKNITLGGKAYDATWDEDDGIYEVTLPYQAAAYSIAKADVKLVDANASVTGIKAYDAADPTDGSDNGPVSITYAAGTAYFDIDVLITAEDATTANKIIRVTITAPATDSSVVSVKGVPVVDGKVTLPSGTTSILASDIVPDALTAGHRASLVSFADAWSQATDTNSLPLVKGANTVYVVFTTQAGTQAEHTITVTVEE